MLTRDEALAELDKIAGKDPNASTPKMIGRAFQTAAMLRDEGMKRRVEDAVAVLVAADPGGSDA